MEGKDLTGSVSGVLMNQGAMLLVLILSFAHSHAKFFANWFIAPAILYMTAKNHNTFYIWVF